MIAPDIRIVDVEPDGFGVLCGLVSSRGHGSRGELHVLHDNGTVRRVVHTLHGPTPDHRGPLGDDLRAAARRLRSAADVDRVVLVDRAGLVAEAQQLAAVGPSRVDQPTMLRRSRQLFWASPAVITDPAPPSEASWERLAVHLKGLGEDYWGLLAGYAGERCTFTLVGRVIGGRIVHLTSLRAVLGDARPPASGHAELVAAAERLGPLPFVLVATLDVLRSVARSADLPAALAACAPQALTSRGLPT